MFRSRVTIVLLVIPCLTMLFRALLHQALEWCCDCFIHLCIDPTVILQFILYMYTVLIIMKLVSLFMFI